MNLGKRDPNRPGLFGSTSTPTPDAESLSAKFEPEVLERQNDQAIAKMHQSAASLRQVTLEIHEEVEAHHRLLDQMATDMDSTRTSLRGVMGKFKQVLEHKGSKSISYVAGVIVLVFLLLRFLF